MKQLFLSFIILIIAFIVIQAPVANLNAQAANATDNMSKTSYTYDLAELTIEGSDIGRYTVGVGEMLVLVSANGAACDYIYDVNSNLYCNYDLFYNDYKTNGKFLLTGNALIEMNRLESIYSSNYFVVQNISEVETTFNLTDTYVQCNIDIYSFRKNIDTTKPVISQEGDMFLTDYDNPISLVVFKSKITAHDNVDGNITSRIVFESNYGNEAKPMPGNYYLKATVSDSYGNTTTFTYPIMVVDTKDPVFSGTFNYTNEVPYSTLTLEDIKAGLSCKDNVDVDIPSSEWTITDGYSVNKDKVGTFNIVFTATDSSGNKNNCTVVITNVDLGYPEWGGNFTHEIEVGTELTTEQILNDVMCQDNYDGVIDRSKWIIQDGYNSNYNTVGVSQITLSYTDSNGNENSCVIDIRVCDTTKPTITGDMEISSAIKLTNEQILALFTYSDNYTLLENLVISVKSTNFVDSIGKYEYVISCVDEAFNETLFTLKFNYIDDEAPVIYASGTVRVPAGTTLTHEQLCAILETLKLIEPMSYKKVDFESDYFNNLSTNGDYEVKAKITLLDNSVEEKIVKFNVFSPLETSPATKELGFFARLGKFFSIIFNIDKNYRTLGFWSFFTKFPNRCGQAWDILVKNKPYIVKVS